MKILKPVSGAESRVLSGFCCPYPRVDKPGLSQESEGFPWEQKMDSQQNPDAWQRFFIADIAGYFVGAQQGQKAELFLHGDVLTANADDETPPFV